MRTGLGTEGSILVVGIPLGLLLTGVVWHLVGVANAVLLAELLRYSADQVAFESAIWHARGMNILALLNLLMTALAGVFVAWRILEVAIPLAGTLCIPGQPACEGHTPAYAYDLGDKLEEAEPRVRNWLSKQIVQISQLERTTATVTPVIALNRATQVRNVTDPGWLRFAMPFTASLVPDDNLDGLIGRSGIAEAHPRMNLGTNLPSLPIEAASRSTFCGMSAPLVPQIADELLTRMGERWVANVFAEAEYDIEEAWRGLGEDAQCLGQKADVAAIWEYAKPQRGEHYHEYVFQVYAASFGNFDRTQQDENAVSIAGQADGQILVKNNWTVSQAEYYFDCEKKESWAKCADSSLYAPNWTARLRRVRVPEYGQVANVWSSLQLPPSFRAVIPSDILPVLESGSQDVWERVEKLIH